MGESRAQKSSMALSVAVLLLAAVYVGHLYLDELVLGVQWIATEFVTPLFDLDQYF